MTIAIANPRMGGAKHTSARRAEEFVSRGMARITRDGKLEFLDSARIAHRAAEMRQTLREERREFERKGIVFWNGDRGEGCMFPPGAYSGRCCPAIPFEVVHPFHSMLSTYSGRSCPVIPWIGETSCLIAAGSPGQGLSYAIPTSDQET